MTLPGSDHLIFIPTVLLVGIALGYTLGARAARAAAQERSSRAKE